MVWFEFSHNVSFLAEHLCMQGRDAWTIYDLYEDPEKFTDEYEKAIGLVTEAGIRKFEDGA